ncbi:Dihydrofolate synthase [Rhodopirellula islandica]|uniref:Dihydrofolate synthase/folylpolyglutamate synthase n=1 Tax=Rhodopirellula islandica TaxID=595434 RepID=A0A0J1BIC6_RHOIS|nr:cyanophycin synthetase [Rhodopirellula islandica]KLU06300.1 Dihydrofolate synthase [Rhodopirellula islandica]
MLDATRAIPLPASLTTSHDHDDSNTENGSTVISRDSDAYQTALGWLVDRIDYEKLAAPGSRYRFTLERMRDLIRRLGHGQHLTVDPREEGEHTPSSGDNTPANRFSPSVPTSTITRSNAGHSDAQGGQSNAGRNTAEGPQNQVQIVHLAGTKGKGSAATMVAALLHAAGYRVGLYTSPHLVHLEERFRVDGEIATPEEMIGLIDSMRPIVEAMAAAPIGGPSFFELTTAMAIEHFHRHQCDVWVLETGLGGRLDSTNVFQSHATAITSIGLDHQHVLGKTVELIAAEKAGIFKPGIPAINGVPPGPVRDVIVRTAEQVGAPLSHLGSEIQIETDAETNPNWGSRFRIRGLSDWMPAETKIELKLEGAHQVQNAAIALALVNSLPEITPKLLPEQRIHECLASLQIEARLERFQLPGDRIVLLDTAHNADSIEAMLNVLNERMHDRRKHCLFGTSADKNVLAMFQRMQPHFDCWTLTRYEGNPRFVPVADLHQAAILAGLIPEQITQSATPITAIQHAVGSLAAHEVLVICGSFFLAAELRPWLVQQRDQLVESPESEDSSLDSPRVSPPSSGSSSGSSSG